MNESKSCFVGIVPMGLFYLSSKSHWSQTCHQILSTFWLECDQMIHGKSKSNLQLKINNNDCTFRMFCILIMRVLEMWQIWNSFRCDWSVTLSTTFSTNDWQVLRTLTIFKQTAEHDTFIFYSRIFFIFLRLVEKFENCLKSYIFS